MKDMHMQKTRQLFNLGGIFLQYAQSFKTYFTLKKIHSLSSYTKFSLSDI